MRMLASARRNRAIAAFALLSVFVLIFSLHASAETSDETQKISRPGQYQGYSPVSYWEGRPTSFYLTMRDGVKIAVDLHLPAGLPEGEKIPTILYQTRYVRSVEHRWPFSIFMESSPWTAHTIQTFVTHGYAWVQVDARGSGASFGTRAYPWTSDEVKDGGEIVDWIISQPWSDGIVGSLGWSYTGTTNEFLLVNNHPAVKAVAPRFALFDVYTDIAFPGGMHLTWFTENWARFNSMLDRNAMGELGFLPSLLVKGTRPVDADRDRSLLAAAVEDHRNNASVYEQALGITYRDDVAPSNLGTVDVFSPHSYVDKLNSSGAAVYSFSGWFDGAYQHAAIKRFLTLKNPGKLTIGPWDHSIHIRPWWPGATRPAFDFDREMLRFFDYHLKGIDNGVMDEPAIHYYTLVEEAWKTADTWPPPARSTTLYFSANNELLPDTPDSTEGSDIYQVDYTAGTDLKSRWVSLANVKGETIEYIGWIEKDRKLLCYTSAPVEEDTEVTGHPVVRLYASSSVDDGGFFVYLQDVHPDGEVTYITEGQLRALHRKLSDDEPPYVDVVPYHSFKRKDGAPLVPGAPAELVFDLLPTSYLFKRGHSIRVAIGGADKDHFALLTTDPSPTLEFYRTRDLASSIELPVIPR